MGKNYHLAVEQLAYAAGMMGWSMLTNTIIVMLPLYYLPPSNAGLIRLVPQLLLLGVLNLVSVIFASGRLIDAVYGPLYRFPQRQAPTPKAVASPSRKRASLPGRTLCFLTFHPQHKGREYAQHLVADHHHDPFSSSQRQLILFRIMHCFLK